MNSKGSTTQFQVAEARPRAPIVNDARIPPELRSMTQWVCWRYHFTGQKWTKVPHNAITQQNASTNKPDTWCTFEVALAEYEKGHFDGIGFVFTVNDPYVGIDLDGCRDAVSGLLSPDAEEVIRRFATYAEISPSGTGIKLICTGDLQSFLDGKSGARSGRREAYQSKRFFTLTGHVVGDHSIRECQEALKWFATEKLKPQVSRSASLHSGGVVPAKTDQEIWDAIDRSKSASAIQALMSGDTSGNNHDDSAADFALCTHLAFWFGNDRERIERNFNRSVLSQRDKWKNRPDYRQLTIEKAISSNTQCYGSHSISIPHHTDKVSQDIYTDLWNARHLVDRFGKSIRFVYQWGKWLTWNGRCWQIDTDGTVMRAAKAIADELSQRAEQAGDKKLLSHAIRTGMASRLEAMISLAATEPNIPLDMNELDRDPQLLNCLNGTVNLETGEILSHCQDKWMTKLVPVEYHPDATCPLWLSFLNKVMNHDKSLIDYLARAVGYSLSGLVCEQVVFFLHGTGANGKSVFLSTLQSVLGLGYSMQAMPELLMCKSGERHPTELADLFGKRLVVINETEAEKQLAESLLKQLSGGDRLRARRMREDFWEFAPTHKIWIAGNHKPQIKGQDYGIWRRVHLIPWLVTILPEQQDKGLPEKLREEASGILAWAVDGYRKWRQMGLTAPSVIKEATDQYRNEQDQLGQFIEECCLLGNNYTIASGELHQRYTHWLSGGKPPSNVVFAELMQTKGFSKSKHTKTGKIMWNGITLRDESFGQEASPEGPEGSEGFRGYSHMKKQH